jgi:DNA-binding response OmpR family regulator
MRILLVVGLMTPPRTVLEPADGVMVPRHPEHNLTVQPAVRNERRSWRGAGEERTPMKLLLVEDDAKIAGALRRGLTAEGFAVEVVGDGLEGLWRAQEGAYDLILLDIMLPGRNGYRVCADLRHGGNTTPILMLTAKDGHLDEAEGLDTGADDYLRKPFSFPVLVARIHALLRRAALGEPPPLVVGDLRLDIRARRVRRADAEIPLTTREFDLLTYLVRRAGQVVTKANILAGVWDDDFEGDPNVVEVYVARLRRKLDGPSGRSSIETVRGAGYRIPLP